MVTVSGSKNIYLFQLLLFSGVENTGRIVEVKQNKTEILGGQ